MKSDAWSKILSIPYIRQPRTFTIRSSGSGQLKHLRDSISIKHTHVHVQLGKYSNSSIQTLIKVYMCLNWSFQGLSANVDFTSRLIWNASSLKSCTLCMMDTSIEQFNRKYTKIHIKEHKGKSKITSPIIISVQSFLRYNAKRQRRIITRSEHSQLNF